jgi:RNA polymerase sigma-70 factor (ECF subfamily)
VNSPDAGRNGDQGVGQLKPALPDWAVRSLDVLTGDQREVLRLRVVVGLSAEETATVLGSTADLVRILQHHALNQLRRALEPEPR